VKERQPGESKNDASDTYNTNNNAAQPAGEANGQARGQTRSQAGNREEREAGPSVGQSGSGSSGAGALQAMQTGLGGHRRADCECARHAFCLPVLPKVASRSRAG